MEYKQNKKIDDLFILNEDIETDNYFIRSLGRSDWEDLIEIYQNKYLHMYSSAQYIYSEKMAINLLTSINYNFLSRKAITWMIVRKDDNEKLGILSLSNISNSDKKVEIGYVLKEIEMGKGIMSEVLKKIINVLLEFGFVRIEANIYKNNIPSIKLCEKMGFENEGLRRKYLFNSETNEYLDSFVFAIISDEK